MTTQQPSNIQDALKALAVIAMIIDHIGYFFYPEIQLFRVIGRAAIPIFSFCAGYNSKAPNMKILAIGILLSLIVSVMSKQIYLNILLFIFLGQVSIYYFGDKASLLASAILPLSLAFASLNIIHFVILGYLRKSSRNISTALILALLSCFGYNILGAYFNVLNIILIGVVLGVVYFLLSLDLQKQIKPQINLISRNTLSIYSIHFMMFYLIKFLN